MLITEKQLRRLIREYFDLEADPYLELMSYLDENSSIIKDNRRINTVDLAGLIAPEPGTPIFLLPNHNEFDRLIEKIRETTPDASNKDYSTYLPIFDYANKFY